MKICSHCVTSILESKKSWGYHCGSYGELHDSCAWTPEQPTYSSVKGRKLERCLFCSTLNEDIEKLAPNFRLPEYAPAWPAYRWSIRSLSKVRESLETVAITFRHDARLEEMEEYGLKPVELPTRTFFLFPEGDLRPLPTEDKLGFSTNPAENGGHQIRAWVETCDMTHADCMKRRKSTPRANRFVPTRLLDISGAPGSSIRVIETASTSVQGPYCTLSHRWGDIGFIELRDSNKEKFTHEGIEWHLFPKNFQDAIEIARAIDVGYIWIDSLCIIQKNVKEWEHEASRMHLVYRNSYCNIAIADSKDSTGGAFRSRYPEDVVPVRYEASNVASDGSRKSSSAFFRDKTWVAVPENLWEKELSQLTLYKRGWVFQERMLAPRILHFAHNQVFWDCPSLSACETLPNGLPQSMDSVAGPDRHWRARLQEPDDSHEPLAGAIDQSLGPFWKTAVHSYTECQLKKGSDKLIAMWGIAKLLRDAMGVEYGKGLWEENLEDQLTWRVEECKLIQRPSESSNSFLTRDIPSWSWASMDGTIIISDRMSDQPHFTVKDHDGQPLSFDLKGVKRSLYKAPKRSNVTEVPQMPPRGISDSGAELTRRHQQLEKENVDMTEEKEFHRSTSPEKISRHAEPVFNQTSILIQGHVGRGDLRRKDDGKEWLLFVERLDSAEIEAFPDLIPSEENGLANRPYFIVLAAKQVLRPQGFGAADDVKVLDAITESPQSTESSEVAFGQEVAAFDYAGHGILMKDVGNNHFRRIGAFRFQNIDTGAFSRLQQTEGASLISSDMYDPKRGRKFWLD